MDLILNTIIHDGSWNYDELKIMAKGERVDRNGKRYAICSECRKVVRIDKPIIGNLHLCNEH